MAAAPILVLSLGTQSLALGEFTRGTDGALTLRRYRRQEILADPAADDKRLPQVRLALRELRDALQIKSGTPISYALSGQMLFTRFVKVPAAAPERLAEMAGFEVQQNVPVAIDEIVWDWQVVVPKDAADDQAELILVAVKADALEELNDAVENAGFRPQVVDAAPMALYNAFRYNYPGLPGCSLLVDVGARNTNLVFVEPGRVFARSVPTGGTKVTEALAKEFGEAFAAAENRKKAGAYIALGGAYAEDKDPEIARASKVIRNAMTRLHAEIVRNVNSYRAQQGGTAPNRIYLCGGGVNLGFAREFFGEKFNVPVDFLNPFRNVAVAPSADLKRAGRDAHAIGELVGLALRSATHCPMELNLPPSSLVRARRDARRRPALALAGACVLLALGGWWFQLHRAADLKQEALAQVEGRVREMQGVEAQMKKSRADLASLQAQAAPLVAVANDREWWPKVVAELNARLPENFLWITSLEPTRGGAPLDFAKAEAPMGVAAGAPGGTAPGAPAPSPTPPGPPRKAVTPARPVIDGLRVRGLYLVNPAQDRVIVDYVQALATSPLFDLDLNNQAAIITKRSPQNATDWAFEYELQLKLKNPLPTP